MPWVTRHPWTTDCAAQQRPERPDAPSVNGRRGGVQPRPEDQRTLGARPALRRVAHLADRPVRRVPTSPLQAAALACLLRSATQAVAGGAPVRVLPRIAPW